jgi:diguanylate cyclase (GGDEF)-like protein/PAS domain S-box-containing protein
MSENKTPTFFSLKWKAGLLFGTVLLVFNALVPIMVYWNLQQKFELSRAQIQKQFKQELIGQLQNTSDRLQRLAELSIIAENTNSDSITQALNKSQSKLELDWHTTQAQLFDNNGKRIGGWGQNIPQPIADLVTKVLTSESAEKIIDCKQGCKQYDLIPVLTDHESTLVLVFSYDMSNALVDFTNKTAANVAIITKQQELVSTVENTLTPWNMQISVLTSFQKNIAYLHFLANNYSYKSLIKNNQLVRNSELPVELNVIQPEGYSELLFIIIDDISTQQKEIRAIIIRSILLSILGILVLGCSLFFLISRPLNRLSIVSEALPLLAKQRYESVRKLISHHKNKNRIDELDQLEQSTDELTSQLEYLQLSVKERTESLHTSSIELKQERDFVKNLIDTAQLIIITIDRKCNITSFNDYAEEVTGYLEKDIINTSFERFFPTAYWPEVESTLFDLKNSLQSVSQQESEFIHQDGTIHIISWLHSSLAHPTTSSVILSVGLDITDKKRSEQQIIWLAEHDMLTELYNRRKFHDMFEQILENSLQLDTKGMLLFLDLDQFKDINDSCGHKVGDQVLKAVAHLLPSITGESDIIARIGGDEFAIILPSIDNLAAISLAEKIAAELAIMNITFNNIRFKLTCSIGLLEFPLVNLAIDELISNADLAMYQAKAIGKNTWHQFNIDDQTRSQLEIRILWKQKIEDALENNRFIFYYQPIMNIRKRTVSHYEMLIRMQDTDGTIHSPFMFIPVAEATGLINNIDHLVLQHGIYKQAELDASGSEITLSINLSGHAVDDKLLLPLFKRLLDESKVDPNHLIFELTETSAVADIIQAKHLMAQLSELGCRFSLDDFGTGFASFRYMRELPVDIVKIDGSFITNLAENPDDQLFVKALVDVARGMGKKTIAEFVENAETLALLHAFGVDYAQGYYIGQPQPYFIDALPILK